MTGVFKTVSDLLLKALYFLLQYAVTSYHCMMRFLKMRLHNWRKCGLDKELNGALKQLGSEVNSLHVQGEADWQNMPSVKQRITRVREAEAKILQADERKASLAASYSEKREQVREKYRSKRSQIGVTS